jgi:hypothetical protein
VCIKITEEIFRDEIEEPTSQRPAFASRADTAELPMSVSHCNQHSVNYSRYCSTRITLKLIKKYNRQLSVLKFAVYRLTKAAAAISDVRHFRLTLPL